MYTDSEIFSVAPSSKLIDQTSVVVAVFFNVTVFVPVKASYFFAQ